MQESFIRGITVRAIDTSAYPYSIPAVQQLESLRLSSPVTFLVGENGSGKSTIIEAIAVAAGFNAEGGTKNYNFSTHDTTSSLKDSISLVRNSKREKYGYFLRAETFYTTANYADSGLSDAHGSAPIMFGNKRIHEQSHGEAFLSIIKSFGTGLFIFDEPESALSPQRQLSLLVAINDLVNRGSQFIIATHSPILLAYPGAKIYQLSESGIASIDYDDIEHVTLTKDFLNNPQQYLLRLFNE